MHGLGSVQNVMNPWAVFNPWTTQEHETQSKLDGSNEGSRFHIDDAAAATVNPWAVFNPWDTQEQDTLSTSGGLNEGSRFHISDEAQAAANPWAVFNPWDTLESQQNMGVNTLVKNQIKAEAQKALQCQGNLGSQRVLHLL